MIVDDNLRKRAQKGILMAWSAPEHQVYPKMTFRWMAETSRCVLTPSVLLVKISRKEVGPSFYRNELIWKF